MAPEDPFASDASAIPAALVERIAAIALTPGCYLFKDASARVIYVGKAKSLRKRVASYFQRAEGHPARTLRLMQEVVDIETVSTDSEVEALLLENSLIKGAAAALQRAAQGQVQDLPAAGRSPARSSRACSSPESAACRAPTTSAHSSSRIELNRAYHFLQRVFRFRVCDLDITQRR